MVGILAGVLAGVLAGALAGCGQEPVAVDVPAAGGARADRCADLVGVLPDVLDGHDRRETVPADGPVAAWGDDPPITLVCGGDWPIPPAAVCQQVDGVDWYAAGRADRDPSVPGVLTTVGWEPALRVTVPPERRPPAGVLVDLAAAVKEALERVEPCL